jgi:hypothetical protein
VSEPELLVTKHAAYIEVPGELRFAAARLAYRAVAGEPPREDGDD